MAEQNRDLLEFNFLLTYGEFNSRLLRNYFTNKQQKSFVGMFYEFIARGDHKNQIGNSFVLRDRFIKQIHFNQKHFGANADQAFKAAIEVYLDSDFK